MLTFEHVRKNYDSKRVLEDCSISFEPGKVYALVGPNGTGKSTLMKAAAGLVKINGGTLTYKGQPIGTESKKHIAYMSTEPFYYDYCGFGMSRHFTRISLPTLTQTYSTACSHLWN